MHICRYIYVYIHICRYISVDTCGNMRFRVRNVRNSQWVGMRALAPTSIPRSHQPKSWKSSEPAWNEYVRSVPPKRLSATPPNPSQLQLTPSHPIRPPPSSRGLQVAKPPPGKPKVCLPERPGATEFSRKVKHVLYNLSPGGANHTLSIHFQLKKKFSQQNNYY